MMRTRNLLGLLTLLALVGVSACGDDSQGPTPDAALDAAASDAAASDAAAPDGATPDAASPDAGVPAMPSLGVQIDRDGRPGVSAMLVHTYDSDAAARGAAKDAYNAASDPATWVASYGLELEKNLAILDGLDTMCGNQLLAQPTTPRYQPLASILADDRLYLDSSRSTCSQFFAVELAASSVLPNSDCGGRVPDQDVVDFMYSAFTVGQPSGVGDGVASPGNTAPSTFPFLGAPN